MRLRPPRGDSSEYLGRWSKSSQAVSLRARSCIGERRSSAASAFGQLLRQLADEARGRVEAQFAEERAAARKRQGEPLARAGHAHVAEPPLLGHLGGILFAAAMGPVWPSERPLGKTRSSRPVIQTASNSRPLAACSVISETRSPPLRGVGVAHQRELLEKTQQRRVGAPVLVVRRRGGERRGRVGAVARRLVAGILGAAQGAGSGADGAQVFRPRLRQGVGHQQASVRGSRLRSGLRLRFPSAASSPAQARSNSRAAPTSSMRFSRRSSPSSPSRRRRSA